MPMALNMINENIIFIGEGYDCQYCHVCIYWLCSNRSRLKFRNTNDPLISPIIVHQCFRFLSYTDNVKHLANAEGTTIDSYVYYYLLLFSYICLCTFMHCGFAFKWREIYSDKIPGWTTSCDMVQFVNKTLPRACQFARWRRWACALCSVLPNALKHPVVDKMRSCGCSNKLKWWFCFHLI